MELPPVSASHFLLIALSSWSGELHNFPRLYSYSLNRQEISCSIVIRQSARQCSLPRGMLDDIGCEVAVFGNGDGSLGDVSIIHAFSSE